MKYFFATFLSVLTIYCSGQTKLETEKYLNFMAAINNSSTIGYFTVVKIKNLNSGEVKEICTDGAFVDGALHLELNAGYDSVGSQKVRRHFKMKDRYFELKNEEALRNVGFENYDEKMLDTLRRQYNFKEIERRILKDRQYEIKLSDKKMAAFAHVLFNMGYMTGENKCWGGGLFYIDRNKER